MQEKNQKQTCLLEHASPLLKSSFNPFIAVTTAKEFLYNAGFVATVTGQQIQHVRCIGSYPLAIHI